jgi:hypothetical protein
MIRVRDYKNLWEYIHSQVPEIDHLFLVDDETELTSKIGQIFDGAIILVAVYPSSDSQTFDEDNMPEVDNCVIFLLQKIAERNIDDAGLLDERATTQQIMLDIRSAMYQLMINHVNDTNHHLMHRMLDGKQHIDRERNYIGCNGWSLGFSLKTNGIF